MTDTTTQTEPEFPPETFGLHEISLRRIEPNPLNPRRKLTDIDALSKSIKQRGVLQALLVFPHGKKFRIEAGHRRLAAAQKAGLNTVPCIVKPPPAGHDQLVDMIDENGQREDLAPIEEAQGYQALLDMDWSQSQIADAVSRAPSHVSKRLSLLKLDEPILDLVDKGTLPLDVAYKLAGIEDPKAVKDLVAYGVPSDARINNALDKQKRTEAAAREKAKAEKAGMIVVPAAQLKNGTAALLAADMYAEGLGPVHVLAMTADTHTDTACAAIAIFAGRDAGKQVLPACIEPSAHKGVKIAKANGYDRITVGNIKELAARGDKTQAAARKSNAQAEADKLEEEQRAKFARFDIAAERRRAELAKLIAPTKPGIDRLLHLAIICAASGSRMPNSARTLDIVGDLLGLKATDDKTIGVLIYDVMVDDAKGAAKVACAQAAATLEAHLFSPVSVPYDQMQPYQRQEHNWHHADPSFGWEIDEYFKWLEAAGVQLGDVETEVRRMCDIGEEPEGAASE